MTGKIFYQIVLELARKSLSKIVGEHRIRSKNIHKDTTLPQSIQDNNDEIDTICNQIDDTNKEINEIKLNLKNARARQRANRASLTELLKVQKSKLEGHFSFDEKEISKYGFVVKPQGIVSPIGKMPKVDKLSLSYGDHPGSLDAHWNTVTGFHYYKIQICYLDPTVEENWSDFDTSDISSHTLENLKSGKVCWVRVAVVGTEGQGVWSEPKSMMVP